MVTFQDTLLINIKVITARANSAIKQTTKRLAILAKQAKKTTFRFLGLGLGMLFTGMALKKFFGEFLRSAFNTFQMIIDA